MSLVLFMIGIAVYYCLYQAYFKKYARGTGSDERNEQDNQDSSILLASPMQWFVSLLKKFLLYITDPTDNRHVDASEKPDPFVFRPFMDRFKTYEDIKKAMKEANIHNIRLIVGIDFTASNEWQGRTTYKGYSLHCTAKFQNPYQHIISVLEHALGEYLSPLNGISFDVSSPDKRTEKLQTSIPAFGFGDTLTRDHSTFPLRSDALPCSTFEEVLQAYRDAVNSRALSGPTSYAPIIHKAIEIVEQSSQQYHILVVIADGQFITKDPTAQAIVDASHYPLSIVVVGVGDGPWDTLRQFDDWLPQRQFDNFQFVEYEKIARSTNVKNFEDILALNMLMEIPDQYKVVHKLGYMSDTTIKR